MKSIVRPLVPKFLRPQIRKFSEDLRLKKTKFFFERASLTPSYLDESMLENMQSRYPLIPTSVYGYDAESVQKRGDWRAKEILELLPDSKRLSNFLELGCWDGMVSNSLSISGKAAVALDIRLSGLDKRAKNSTHFVQGDAMSLPFAGQSFDCVFAYDALEHFADPRSMLSEAIRVVKVGGYIYFYAKPLYSSPYGLHVFHQISVPYCQFLFPMEVMQEFLMRRGINPKWPYVNNFGITYYRDLWRQFTKNLHIILYREERNLSFLNLIEKHPSCFKSKTNELVDLLFDTVQVLFKRIA